MGSVGGGADDLEWLAFGCTSSTITSPSAFKDSKNWFVFWDLPSCMPRPFGGAVAEEGGRPKDDAYIVKSVLSEKYLPYQKQI